MNGRAVSRERIGSTMNVLADITNMNGKRVLPLSAQKNDAGKKMGKYAGKLQDSNFIRPSDGSAILKGKEKILAVAGNKEKGLFSFDPKHSADSGNFGCRSDSLQENALASLLTLRMSPDSSMHESTDAGLLEQGLVPGQCTKSSDSSAEFEDDLDDLELDSTKPTRFEFLNEKVVDKCAPSHHTNKVDPFQCSSKGSDGETNFIGIPKPTASLDPDNISVATLHNASASCGEIGIGIEASCKCSFCLKAAYIWTDLHYQDTRGRISALKKSRKLAKSLEVQICSNDWDIKSTRDRTKKQPTELDAELMHHWRSLFHQTDNVLVHETAQLNATVLKLKSLRANCQKDLERMKQVP